MPIFDSAGWNVFKQIVFLMIVMSLQTCRIHLYVIAKCRKQFNPNIVDFQMCRAHGIGFDIKERQGTVFTVIDAVKREEFGML